MPLTLDATNGVTYPSWTTATRPASPTAGQMGYNTTYGGIELYNGSAWTTMSGGPSFSAYKSGNQNISQSTYTKVQLNAETFDTNNNFDSTTNYRFTPTVAGYYQLNGQVQFNTSATVLIITVWKNGVQAAASTIAATLGAGSMVAVSSLVVANGSSDYFELYVYSDNSAPQINSSVNTFFSGFLARGV
jgi:hypothetical protein